MLVIIAMRGSVLSQTLDDSLFVATVSNNVSNYYLNSLNKEAPIYNGRIYRPYPRLENGHTFFLSNEYTSGTIVYNGSAYKDVNIIYDLVRDQLVLVHLDKVANLIVNRDHVGSFFLHNHTFVHIKPDSTGQNRIVPGYYDLLYDGNKIAVLAKRVKKVTETITPSGVEKTVSQQNRYYVFKDSVYTPIRNKKDLTTLLKSTKSHNQQYIRTNKLNFKRDRENAIISLVKFHNSIRL